MRDPKRIPIILDKIKEVWEKNPDLRLCQLLSVMAITSLGWGIKDLFYLEDDKLEEALKKYLK